MENLRLKRAVEFLKNFVYSPIIPDSSILNNFMIVENNLKSIFSAFAQIKDFCLEMYENFDQSKIVESIYNKILNQRYLIDLTNIIGKNLFNFVLDERNLVLNVEKLGTGLYDISVDETSQVKIDIHKFIVQFRGIEAVQYPSVHYHTTDSGLKKIRITFIDTTNESKQILLY